MKCLIKNKHWEINKEYDIDKVLYLLIDRPTIISPYYEYIWMNNDNKWCRDYNLPFVISHYGYIEWGEKNKLHKINKPVIIQSDGSKIYYINDKYLKKKVENE